MLAFTLAITLHFTAPAFEADTSRLASCASTSQTRERVARANLYLAYCGDSNWQRVLARSHPLNAGQADTFQVPDRCATYWVTVTDSAGNESEILCTRGVTVGIPPTSVPEASGETSDVLYDIAGRECRPPLAPGAYFKRTKRGIKVVVIR